ncbi:MAG: Ribonuclease BN protein [Parcubacteria group bacterium GW2011_GWA2_56_7]|nr:MAG: Ribonuclease BN protein [Parcubacteria group bacterium GW2011_GWA2_56_7]
MHRSDLHATINEVTELQRRSPIQTHASAISFDLLFACLPLLLLFVSLVGLFGADIVRVKEVFLLMDDVVPAPMQSFIEAEVLPLVTARSVSMFSIGAILLIWSVSKLIRGLTRSLNQVYLREETRILTMRFILSSLMALILGLLVFGMLNVLVFGQVVATWLSGFFAPSPFLSFFVSFMHWPVFAVGLVFLLTLLYHTLPEHPASHLGIHVPGAVFATLVWIVSGFLFHLSLGIANTFEVYGYIGLTILFALYVKITAYAFLMGAYLNSAREHKKRRLTPKSLLQTITDILASY